MHGEGEYNLNVLKEIQVTDSYLELDQNTRGCQNKEKEEGNISLPQCSGLIVSSYYKSDPKKNLSSLSTADLSAYRKYMKWAKFPSEIQGQNTLVAFVCR